MKKQLLLAIWFICMLGVPGLTALRAQGNMNITLTDGSAMAIAIQDIQSLSFNLSIPIEQEERISQQLIFEGASKPKESGEDFMIINYHDGSVIEIATDDIEKITFSDPTGVYHPSDLEKQLLTLKAFPNPSNDYINIYYTLLESGIVILEILNQTGNSLLKVNQVRLNAGEYHYRWHTHGFPAGTYICLIRQHDTVVSTKIIVKN